MDTRNVWEQGDTRADLHVCVRVSGQGSNMFTQVPSPTP